MIFETFEDASSEYKMSKIKFNLDIFENLLICLSQKETNEVVGFYGDLKNILKHLKNSLNFKISSKDILEYLVKEKIKECVIALTNVDKILLIFITETSFYCAPNKAESNSLKTIYLRFLIDLCRNIFFIPSSDFILNPNNSNPFSDKVNRGLQMIEKIVEPSNKIKLDEIFLVKNKVKDLKSLILKAFNCCSDSSKFLTKAYLKILDFEVENTQDVYHEDIQSQKEKYGFFGYNSKRLNKMKYNEIKSDIKKYWPETDFYFTDELAPRKFEDKIKELLKNFINKESYKQFEIKTGDCQDLYFEKRAQIEKLKDKKGLFLLRKELIYNFFEDIEPMIMRNKKILQYSYNFQFQSINIIRNTTHELENWNINQAPFALSHQFGKDTNKDVTLKRIYFLEENCGIILFAHSPENKSSLFYFNVTNKQNPLMIPIMNLSSHDCDLIIEKNMNLWCVYSNFEKRFNMGKIQGSNFEDGLPIEVYEIEIEGSMIKDIISSSFLNFSDSIFIINQDFQLFELKYISKSLILVWKKENKGSEGVVKTPILPKIKREKYGEVQCTFDGKNIILRSKSTLDIYDLTWSCIYSIPLKNFFVSFKTFTDKINSFLIIIYEEDIKCFHFIGLTASKTVDFSRIGEKQRKEITGNAFLDYFYIAFKKFGPHSGFIGSPKNTKLFSILNLTETGKSQIERYFDQLSLTKVSLDILNEEEGNKNIKSKSPRLKIQVLKAIIMSRVPLHIATIENFTLVPLQNGQNISDQIAENIGSREKNDDLINIISQIIKFGSYEEFLKNYKGSVKVISIVGRQSSGKSYVMNRFFGTRFNVASSRCTDGIWLSMSEVWINESESMLFVLMDCEGLFSARRNDQEEMKLGLNLAAVSDIMILNQDLAFNRYLNQFFANFSKGIGRIKGRKLFKGFLLMLIRDVKSDEAEGAYNELMANMARITSNEKNFLNCLFQGKLKSQCLNYFEQPVFSQEIEWIRDEYFLSLKENRWTNGRDFLESSKIALAQIFVDDDTDMDLHKMNITCEHLFKECLKAFYEGDGLFKESGLTYKEKIVFNDQVFNITIKHEDIAFESESSEEENGDDVEFYPAMKLLTTFGNNTCEYSRKIHNDWFLNFSKFLDSFLMARMDFVIKYFENHFKDEVEFKSVFVNNLAKLTTVLSSFSNKIKFCTKKCRKCERICQSSLNHVGDCDCKTEHRCEANCERSAECKNKGFLCLEAFGHEGNHRCGQGRHMCDHHCDIGDGKTKCLNLCGYESAHQEPGSFVDSHLFCILNYDIIKEFKKIKIQD